MSFLENVSINKKILMEATERGTANDFWLVIDCKDSVEFKEYIHRTNAQGLINTITKLSKSKKTRDCLDTIAIFNKDDKSKAEKEAKRRAKIMKNENAERSDEKNLDDENSLVERTSEQENYERLAAKARQDAKYHRRGSGKDSAKLAKASEALAVYNTNLAKKAAKKESKSDDAVNESIPSEEEVDEIIDRIANKLDENYYADHSTNSVLKPVHKAPSTDISSDQNTYGSKEDHNTVYGMKDKQSRIYSPSEQDAVDNEDERKVKVPVELIKLLRDGAAEARNTAEKLIVTKTEDKQFYTDLAVVFDDMREMLELGTIDGVKQAQTFITTLMGPMLYRIPSEVATFIAQGGEPRPLQSYVNSITVPKIGYGVNGELDKL